ncbi:MAG: nucleotidyltransferase domain-containing protein [Candidatus Aminicenantales bacterium]
MSDLHPSRLFVLCARPDDDAAGSSEALRLAASVRDWDKALAKAEGEGLLPLLYWTLRDDPGAVPGAVLETLRLAYLRNLARTTQVYRELELFLESVRRAGLRAALTKGGRLALDVYSDTALRPFWDVDFIVHPADWARLQGILAGLGFAEATGAPPGSSGGAARALDWAYSPYFKKGSLFLEFHSSPFGLHFPGSGEDGFWFSAGRLRVRGTEALVLPAENELCYLCVHAQQHSYQKLIWLADIARLARRAGLDWNGVCRIATDERIKGPVFYGLHLVEFLWPGSVPPEPRRHLRPGPIESAGLRLLWPLAATAARSDAPSWPYYMPSLFSLWERRDPVLAARTLGQIFFPPKAWLASATGVSVDSPWLYERYAERLLRPALTTMRRIMDPK